MNNNGISTANCPKQGEAKPAASLDSPGVIMFPPVLYVGTLMLGLLLHLLWPAHFSPVLWIRIGGGVVVLAGGLMAHWAQRTMHHMGTNVLPTKPTFTIVTRGPFRFTRNPIYLANVLVYLGLTLVLNTVWPLVLFLPMVLVLYWGIIRREERYLEVKFGESYRSYRARVPRWL